MTSPEPFFRESGSGPGVVCTHSNASTSGQWAALMERLGRTSTSSPSIPTARERARSGRRTASSACATRSR